MLLEANNSHSQGAKVYKRKKSKAHTRRGAKRYQYNLPKHPRHEQQMRPVWRLVADSNNVDIGAVGYLNASHAMRSSSRKNSVEERVGSGFSYRRRSYCYLAGYAGYGPCWWWWGGAGIDGWYMARLSCGGYASNMTRRCGASARSGLGAGWPPAGKRWELLGLLMKRSVSTASFSACWLGMRRMPARGVAGDRGPAPTSL